MARIEEGSQDLAKFPAWAPKPAYRPNGRPVITMVEWLDRQSKHVEMSWLR